MFSSLLSLAALFTVVLIVSGLARAFSRRRLQEARKVRVPSDLTGAEIATRILQEGGAPKVLVLEFNGYLSNCYDPANRRLLLSRSNFRGRSAAAWGVALHEAGHALQHRDNARSYTARVAAIRTCQYLASSTAVLCAVAGVSRTLPLRVAGLIITATWVASFLANLITLPAEWNASQRSQEILERTRAAGTRKEEVEAAMTGYCFWDLGALLTTFSSLAYRLLPFSSKKPASPRPKEDLDTT